MLNTIINTLSNSTTRNIVLSLLNTEQGHSIANKFASEYAASRGIKVSVWKDGEYGTGITIGREERGTNIVLRINGADKERLVREYCSCLDRHMSPEEIGTHMLNVVKDIIHI